MKELQLIYEKFYECILSLSDKAIIKLINGLCNTDYPEETGVEILYREITTIKQGFYTGNVYLKIKDNIYHFKNEMSENGNIVLRIFEYGFLASVGFHEGCRLLYHPGPVVIYLDSKRRYPQQSELILTLSGKNQICINIEHFLYQEQEIGELNKRNLIPLIPFQLLKLIKLFQMRPSAEVYQRIHHIIQHDILDSIESNLQNDSITIADAVAIRELTGHLYEYLYRKYVSRGRRNTMIDLLPKTLKQPNARYLFKIDELEQIKSELLLQNQSTSQKNRQNKAASSISKLENFA